METVNPPIFNIKYNQRDITTDVTPFLHALTYRDSVKGKSDEIELQFSNASGKWSSTWYPTFGDILTVTMGYGHYQFPCGTFEIDGTDMKYAPDIFTIKGLAVGIKTAVRTKVSDTHENKTLEQIAQKICNKHGFTLLFDINEDSVINTPNTIRRVTQNRETDLAFLTRLSQEYGYVFSIRDKVMTFLNVYDLEKLPSATTIFKEDFIPGACSIRDKSWEVYRKAQLYYHNPRTKSVQVTDFTFDQQTNADGYKSSVLVNTDTKVIHLKANSTNEAASKAMAALHSANSRQQEGSLSVRGNPLMVAGNNVKLAGLDEYSGDYHIESSVHRIDPRGGYITSVEIKRVGYIELISAAKKKKIRKKAPIRIGIIK